MIKVNNVTLSLKKGKKIVENLNFILNENDKLAIIGEEGNGKSTLLKLFYDDSMVESYCHFTGDISLKKKEIGYLPQMMDVNWNFFSAEEFLLKRDLFSDIEYEQYENFYKIEKLFDEYELDLNILNNKRLINHLSGGEKIKLQLIKLMIHQPKLYLLDEPTNDLDIQTIELLEKFLLCTSTPIIFISHDETLLTKTANMILHLEQIHQKSIMRFTFTKVNYQTYCATRESLIAKQNAEAYRTSKEKERKRQILLRQHQLVENDLNRAVRQPEWGRLLAKKMKNILAQEKKLDQMEVVEKLEVEDEINLFFSKDITLPKEKIILNIQDGILKLNEVVLANPIHLLVKGREHVTIIGRNGCGKTTLLKQILNELKQTKNIHVGYMPQNYDEELNIDITPLNYLQKSLGYDQNTKNKIMTCLGALNFAEFESNLPIFKLSGGQKAKLFLLNLVLNQYDVLILDEPTRNLSPLSTPIIRRILKEFKGTIFSVSHDRKYIFEVSHKVYSLNKNGLFEVKIDLFS